MSNEGKPYPRHCAFCKKQSVIKAHIKYESFFVNNGKLTKFSIPECEIDKCENCKEEFFTTKSDDMIQSAIQKESK